jgi:hypothetical protein
MRSSEADTEVSTSLAPVTPARLKTAEHSRPYLCAARLHRAQPAPGSVMHSLRQSALRATSVNSGTCTGGTVRQHVVHGSTTCHQKHTVSKQADLFCAGHVSICCAASCQRCVRCLSLTARSVTTSLKQCLASAAGDAKQSDASPLCAADLAVTSRGLEVGTRVWYPAQYSPAPMRSLLGSSKCWDRGWTPRLSMGVLLCKLHNLLACWHTTA